MSKETGHLCTACSTIFAEPTSLDRLTYSGPSTEQGISFLRSLADLEMHTNDGCSLCSIICNTLIRNDDGLALDPDDRLESDYKTPVHAFRLVAKIEKFIPPTLLFYHTMSSTKAMNTFALDESFFAKLSISASPGNALGSFVEAQPISRSYQCDEVFDSIQQRIDLCSRTHYACKSARGRLLPSRLVYVGDPCRIVETCKEDGDYMALSYCWGMPQQPVMTTNKTIQQFKTALPIAQMPRVILDAIYITRRLGLKYLWVDVLCILQDNTEDKTRQIARIPDIFNNACLTICAAKSKTCAESFLDTPACDRDFADFEMPFKCPDGSQGDLVIQPFPYFSLYAEPIHSRGWTLEERLLSPRTLVYSKNFVTWQCRSEQHSITEKRPQAEHGGGWKRDRAIQDAIFHHDDGPNEQKLNRIKRIWIDLLEQYGRREVTDYRDRFRAIAGLASRLQHVFYGHQYIAGAWYSEGGHDRKNSLLYQLLWKQLSIGDYFSHKDRENPIDPRAPSWSWASVSTMTQWGYRDMDANASASIDEWQSDGTAIVISCTCTPLAVNNPFGRVRDARVVIEGPLRTLMSVRFVPDGEDGGFDHGICADVNLDMFECWCDQRLGRTEPTTVTLLRLSRQAGLILTSLTDIGSFQRVGMFQRRIEDARLRWKRPFEDAEIAHLDSLFAQCSTQMVTIW